MSKAFFRESRGLAMKVVLVMSCDKVYQISPSLVKLKSRTFDIVDSPVCDLIYFPDMKYTSSHDNDEPESRVVCGVRARVARSFYDRAKGLIGAKSLPSGEGLLILKCNAIHTFFMSMIIDATFLDSEGRVVRKVKSIKPWRPFVWGGWKARMVLETACQEG